jgi:hypothetical protein
VTFTETISHAPLVVGDQPTVTIKGTAPAGLTYSACDFEFIDAAGTNPYADGTVGWNQPRFTYGSTRSSASPAPPASNSHRRPPPG